jgi:carbamoyltransferase
MSQLILTVHTGIHDAAAAVFEDYALRAAVQLERLTRYKGDGRQYPDLCIDEVLGIVGATRKDVDVLGASRCEFPTEFYRNIRGIRWIREKYRKYVEKNTRRYMVREFLRYNTPRVEDIFNIPKFRQASGFRDDAEIYFYNHHESHALATLFYTQWDDALLFTADAGGDSVNYSQRHFTDGNLTTIYGGEECLVSPLPIDSLAHAYMAMTAALGFIPLRHEGKLTGLAAYGEPILAEKIAAHFSVDETGRIRSDFASYPELVRSIHTVAARVNREDASASIQKVFEDKFLLSARRFLERHKSPRLGLAGGAFANVRLNRVLAEKLPIEEIFIFPAMGDEGMPAGGGLCYLLKRDGLQYWLKQRRELHDVYLGRDYTDTIDAVLGRAPAIRKTAEPPVEGAARRLQAGQLGAIYTGRINPLYYDILAAFERGSGLPVLVNTSFNVHEEPIVNQPSECLKALADGRIDFVVTTRGIYERVAAMAES